MDDGTEQVTSAGKRWHYKLLKSKYEFTWIPSRARSVDRLPLPGLRRLECAGREYLYLPSNGCFSASAEAAGRWRSERIRAKRSLWCSFRRHPLPPSAFWWRRSRPRPDQPAPPTGRGRILLLKSRFHTRSIFFPVFFLSTTKVKSLKWHGENQQLLPFPVWPELK